MRAIEPRVCVYMQVRRLIFNDIAVNDVALERENWMEDKHESVKEKGENEKENDLNEEKGKRRGKKECE